MQSLMPAAVILTALAGLLLGSFLNVCIFRIPHGETIVFGRSHCMTCNSTIKAYDLIPVVSYVLLRGRCRSCGARLSLRYPLVELLNAALWVCCLFAFGLTAYAAASMAFASVLLVISFIDLDTRMIPNGCVLILLPVGLCGMLADASQPFYAHLLGIAAAGLPLLVIALVARGGMGGGDVKFALAAGLFLGWRLSLLALFLAFVVGAVCSVFLMLVFKKGRKSSVPFAPFLSVGFLAAAFFGQTLLRLYFSLFALA